MTHRHCPEFPVERIHGDNIRSNLGSDESLRELGESLLKNQLQDIGVTESGLLLWGGRRTAAAMLVGKKTLSAKVLPDTVTEEEVVSYQAIENLQRLDLSDLDKHVFCVKLSATMSNGEIAKAISVSPGSVTKYLSPRDCPQDAQAAFRAGDLTLGQCYKISTSPEPLVTMRLFLGGETHEKAARKSRKPAVAAVRSQKIPVPLPGGATVLISAESISLEEAVEALDEAKKAITAAIKRGLNAKTAVRVFADVAAAS